MLFNILYYIQIIKIKINCPPSPSFARFCESRISSYFCVCSRKVRHNVYVCNSAPYKLFLATEAGWGTNPIKGIVTVGDLSGTGVFLKGANVLNANFSLKERFKLMSTIDAIAREWRQIIRESTQHSLPSHIGDNVYLKLENSKVTLSKVSSKLLYNAFKSKKQIPPTAQMKFQEKFPQLQADWREIYSLPFTVSIEYNIKY